MKRKTFVRLRTVALSILLVEAMMMLVLLLVQTGASARDSDFFQPSHNGTHSPPGSSDPAKTEASDSARSGNPGHCGRDNPLCALWGDAADITDWDGIADGFWDIFHQDGAAGNGGSPAGNDAPPLGPAFSGGPFFASSGFGQFGDGPGSPGNTDSSGNSEGPSGNSGPGHLSGPDFGGDFAGPFTLDAFNVPPITDGSSGGDSPDDGANDPPPANSPSTRSLAVVPVPEPLTVSVFAAGLAATLFMRRRRRPAP